MKKVERLIALLYLLKRKRHRGLRTREIAEELGITERTVYRDINSLNEAFKDYVQIIYMEDGYYLDRTIYTPPLRLINRELDALSSVVMAQDHHPHIQLARQALSKMKSAYADSNELDLLTLENRLQIMAPVPQDRVDPERLLELEVAIAAQSPLAITYFSYKSQETKVLKISPYALVLRNHAWYLLGHSQEHGQVIHLRTYRIREIQPGTLPFHPDPEFNIKAFFAEHWSMFKGEPVPVQLRFQPVTAQLVAEIEWHPSQVLLPQVDESLILELKVPLNPELVSWILSWGSGCQVLGPLALKQEIKQAVAALVDNYLRE